MIDYLFPFLISFLVAFFLMPIAIKVGLKLGAHVKDDEVDLKRHVHTGKVSRFGGVAIFISLLVLAPFFITFDKSMIGLFLAAGLLMVLGVADDIWRVHGRLKLVGQFFVVGILIFFGVGVDFITNPFGGILELNTINFPILTIGDVTYHVTLWADLVTLLWVLFVINAINFIDGIDGLASGVSLIGFITILFLSLEPDVFQPQIANLAAILAGSLVAFLGFNMINKNLFLGDAGSFLLGFMLATLAIISGAKIATISLVLLVALIDALFVPFWRIVNRKSPFSTDNSHLHFRLIELGVKPQNVAFIFWGISLALGLTSLFLESYQKFVLLSVITVSTIILLSLLVWKLERRGNKRIDLASNKP